MSRSSCATKSSTHHEQSISECLRRLTCCFDRRKSVIALQKRIYTTPGIKQLSQGLRHVDLNASRIRSRRPKERAVLVDAIVDAGRTWIKVSLVTNQRLIFDLAKQGWHSGGSDDDFGDDAAPADDQEDRDVTLLRTAKELTKAAQCFRAKTKTPAVRIILPRIVEGEIPEVDAILNDCRATGALLICGKELEQDAVLETYLESMAPDPIKSFSDVLNIDCTILLALVSEFSHAKVSKEPWFHAALCRQVEIEGNENLLPSLLYPGMVNRRLVCTEEAVKRMREIVDTIGTPSEKARTVILLGDDESKTQLQLVGEMQEWSAYTVPLDWQLPIHVVSQNEGDCQSSLPPQALQVSAEMTDINKSVFLYGWASGRTTITSNRSVVKQIETDLEKFDELDDGIWPSIWLCPTARSLVGKEKRGAKKEEPKTGAWPLPDPLRREEQRRNGLDVLSLREGCEVEDRRPNGYPCEEVLAAKNASLR